MILKQGVKIANLKPQLIIAIMVANDVYRLHGKELVITSVDDSKHGKNTLHGSGSAFDCRTSYFMAGEAERVANEIRAKIDEDFDIAFETDHLHIEYDPK